MDTIAQTKNHILLGTAFGAPIMVNDEVKGIIATCLTVIVSSVCSAVVEVIKRRFRTK